jgi:hypothetical protein
MERGYHYGEWQPLISAASLGDTGTGADGLNRFNAASATAFPVVSRQIDTSLSKPRNSQHWLRRLRSRARNPSRRASPRHSARPPEADHPLPTSRHSKPRVVARVSCGINVRNWHKDTNNLQTNVRFRRKSGHRASGGNIDPKADDPTNVRT